MKDVTLYGQGAIVIYSGKTVYRSENGSITVPEHFVPQAEAQGYSTTREPVGAPDPLRLKTADEMIATTKVTDAELARLANEAEDRLRILRASTDARKAKYTTDAEEAGYAGETIAQIVDERLRFDELIAGGMDEEKAVQEVWPSQSS